MIDIEELKKRINAVAEDARRHEQGGGASEILCEALDAIEQLQRELSDAICAKMNACRLLDSALERMKAELEEVRMDAERYGWLRNSSAGQWTHPIVVSQQKVDDRIAYIGPLSWEALDAAIDAAREKKD